MTMRAAAVALLALLLPVAHAWGFDEQAATRMVLERAQAAPSEEGLACGGTAPWGDPAEGLRVVAAANETTGIAVALMRVAEGVPAIVAGPARVEPITIDPLWGCLVDVVRLQPLGGRPVVAIELSNTYISTGRSTSTRSLHLLLREGERLQPIYGATLSETSSEDMGRGRRSNVSRRWVVIPVAAQGATMPDLVVRDVRTRQQRSRSRWRNGRYEPPAFDGFR